MTRPGSTAHVRYRHSLAFVGLSCRARAAVGRAHAHRLPRERARRRVRSLRRRLPAGPSRVRALGAREGADLLQPQARLLGDHALRRHQGGVSRQHHLQPLECAGENHADERRGQCRARLLWLCAEPHAGERGRARPHAAPPRVDGPVHARGAQAPRADGARVGPHLCRPLHRRRQGRPRGPDAVGNSADRGAAFPWRARGRHGHAAQILDCAHRQHLGPAQAGGAGGRGACRGQFLAVRRQGAREDAARPRCARLDAVRHPQAEAAPGGGDRFVPALDDDGRHCGRARNHRQCHRQRGEAAAAAPQGVAGAVRRPGPHSQRGGRVPAAQRIGGRVAAPCHQGHAGGRRRFAGRDRGS